MRENDDDDEMKKKFLSIFENENIHTQELKAFTRDADKEIIFSQNQASKETWKIFELQRTFRLCSSQFCMDKHIYNCVYYTINVMSERVYVNVNVYGGM